MYICKLVFLCWYAHVCVLIGLEVILLRVHIARDLSVAKVTKAVDVTTLASGIAVSNIVNSSEEKPETALVDDQHDDQLAEIGDISILLKENITEVMEQAHSDVACVSKTPQSASTTETRQLLNTTETPQSSSAPGHTRSNQDIVETSSVTHTAPKSDGFVIDVYGGDNENNVQTNEKPTSGGDRDFDDFELSDLLKAQQVTSQRPDNDDEFDFESPAVKYVTKPQEVTFRVLSCWLNI